MTLLFKGLVILLLVKILADLLDLYTVGLLLEYIIQWGPLALIIIFQPEIRSALEQLGRTQLLGRHKTLTLSERESQSTWRMFAHPDTNAYIHSSVLDIYGIYRTQTFCVLPMDSGPFGI